MSPVHLSDVDPRTLDIYALCCAEIDTILVLHVITLEMWEELDPSDLQAKRHSTFPRDASSESVNIREKKIDGIERVCPKEEGSGCKLTESGGSEDCQQNHSVGDLSVNVLELLSQISVAIHQPILSVETVSDRESSGGTDSRGTSLGRILVGFLVQIVTE
ncbi:hypothetical protein CAPTEDRAFT_206418 [Capitella teleta]|uniref:Uncharacterized protein n=1 Tax=Capitella teleta TaxID=283909 RepID=R7T8P4_CAPTE|nr:hypothetical protein CAPTEDRAFT_206418 [Capitella teleta]|eukprot:ELT90044.1 hypothetical protein CAPTEDRAFT_206418 [Capitella teleta]